MRSFILVYLFFMSLALTLHAEEEPVPVDVCVVSGKKLGSMGDPVSIQHNGQEVLFCCASCIDDFKENPSKFLSGKTPVRKAKTIKIDEAVVEVKGMVCSFCAVGVKKGISKLDFIVPGRFSDGANVDIDTQEITFALDLTKPIDLKAIKKSMKKAGYEMVKVTFIIKGMVERKEEGTMLQHQNGQLFRLYDLADDVSIDEPLTLKVQVDSALVKSDEKNNIISVLVETVL